MILTLQIYFNYGSFILNTCVLERFMCTFLKAIGGIEES